MRLASVYGGQPHPRELGNAGISRNSPVFPARAICYPRHGEVVDAYLRDQPSQAAALRTAIEAEHGPSGLRTRLLGRATC